MLLHRATDKVSGEVQVRPSCAREQRSMMQDLARLQRVGGHNLQKRSSVIKISGVVFLRRATRKLPLFFPEVEVVLILRQQERCVRQWAAERDEVSDLPLHADLPAVPARSQTATCGPARRSTCSSPAACHGRAAVPHEADSPGGDAPATGESTRRSQSRYRGCARQRLSDGIDANADHCGVLRGVRLPQNGSPALRRCSAVSGLSTARHLQCVGGRSYLPSTSRARWPCRKVPRRSTANH